jgi:sirohydrochlorin cobaltochelatase
VITGDRSTESPRGVLLIGHGTRDLVGMDQFFELGAILKERLSPLSVQSAVLEFGRPTIPEAWERLVSAGVNHIHVSPLLLFAAGHAKGDIPKIIADCHAQTPNVSFESSRPISRHRSIIDLVMQRLETGYRELATPPSRTAVVMVGRGSHDPCAQADMRVLSAIVGKRIGAAATQTAFYAMAQPRLPDVLDRLAVSGQFEGIAVHPHLLFEGRLYQAIVEQAEESALRYPTVKFVTSRYLGPDALVADAVAARIGVRSRVEPLTSRTR